MGLTEEMIFPVDINEEVKQSFLDYSVSVITDRALPDVRDGMKPVHRRIIYAMNNLKLSSNKPHRKSAQVVGEVLAKLHPHGDSSVYEAMVRLAQDFSLNYPLVDGHGNFGNIDGDPAAAYRYCLTGDSLIKTNKGTMPIEELSQYAEGENLEGILIQDYNGNFVPATRFFNSGEHNIYKLKIKNGQELKGTGNHPVLMLNPDNFNLQWVKMEDIKIGQKVALPYFKGYDEDYIVKKGESLEAKALGVMISEGYVTTQNRIGVNNKDKHLVEVVAEFLQTKTNSSAKINKNKDYYEFCIADKTYQKQFISEYAFGDSYEKQIPNCIWKETRENRAVFLSYLFEGDGSPVLSNSYIVYSSVSKRLIDEIQIMLLQDFSIFSYQQKDGKEYKLIIAGNDVQGFNNRIGFVSERKRELSSKIEKVYNGKNNIAHNSYHSTQELSNYIRSINNSDLLKRNACSNVKNFIKAKPYIDKDEYQRINNLLMNFMFVEVTEIEDTEKEENVYSVRVDNLESEHSFVANGFINHNTEARLSKIGEEMLRDLDKDTVDWKPNFSEDVLEPVVLPTRLPQLLINGTSGIAVGMACSFVPHNLEGITKAITAFIYDPEISTKELLEISGGPDFPTGGLVINKKELLKGYQTGRGRIRIRAQYRLEKREGRDLIVFYEIPFMTKKTKIVEDIAKLVEEKEIEGISDVRDESAQDMRVVIELKRGQDPNTIVELLFAKTQLENTFSINNTCLVDGQPKTLSFKELISHYVHFQQEVVTRRTKHDLKNLEKRLHKIQGMIISLENIDEVIKIIKESSSSGTAKDALMERFLLTEVQASTVLAMRLSSLTKLEISDLRKEQKQLEKRRKEYKNILSDTDVLNGVVIGELKSIATPHYTKRRTQIVQAELSQTERKQVVKKIQEVNLSISSDNIVSFVTDRQFKSKKNREQSQYQISTNTGEHLIVFMSDGKIYRVPVEDLQAGSNLTQVIGVHNGSKIVNILTSKNKQFIIFLTQQGMVKKTKLSEYENIRRTGVIGIRLKEGDRVVAVSAINEEPIIILTKNGQTIHIPTKDISHTGRNAMGVIGVKLSEQDEAVDFAIVDTNKEFVVTISQNGMVKKTALSEYPQQGRNGKGVIGVKLSEGDQAHAIRVASDKETLMVFGTERLVKTPVKDLSLFGRNSVGNMSFQKGKVTNINMV